MSINDIFLSHIGTKLDLRLYITHIDINKGIKSHIGVLAGLCYIFTFVSERFFLGCKSTFFVFSANSFPIFVVDGDTPSVAFISIPFVFINCHC